MKIKNNKHNLEVVEIEELGQKIISLIIKGEKDGIPFFDKTTFEIIGVVRDVDPIIVGGKQ